MTTAEQVVHWCRRFDAQLWTWPEYIHQQTVRMADEALDECVYK